MATEQELAEKALTKREMEFLVFFAQGYSVAEAASLCFVSPETSRTHLRRIRGKLGGVSIHQCAAIARDMGIVNTTGSNPSKIPMEILRERNKRWIIESDAIPDFIEFNGCMKVELREWQLVPSEQDDQKRSWVRLSGWISKKHDRFDPTTSSMVLSDTHLTGRECPVGHKVEVTVTRYGAEYGTGLFMVVRWPRGFPRKRSHGSASGRVPPQS